MTRPSAASPIDRSISLRQLRYFVTVAEELSFRRAAERLHVTQPPLSRQIAALESALGASLLERNTRSTRLTPAGVLALGEFKRLLAEFESVAARVAAAAPRTRERIRIGMLWWSDLSKFSRFEATLRRASGVPLVEPVLSHSIDVLARVARNEIDAGLVVLPQDLDGLAHRIVARVDHVAMVPANSALARKRALRLRELEALPAFLRFKRSENPTLWDHFQRQYQAAGFKPQRERQAPGTSATVAQIAAGHGCTVMPVAFARQKHPGVAARRLLDPVVIDVAMVFSPRLEPELQQAVAKAASRLKAVLA